MKLKHIFIGLLCGLIIAWLGNHVLPFALILMIPVTPISYFVSNNIVEFDNFGRLLGIVSYSFYGVIGILLGAVYGLMKKSS